MYKRSFIIILALFTLLRHVALALPPGTAFNYEGRLIDSGNPVTGNYDLTFSVFDAPNAGNRVGSPLTNTLVGVTNGHFTTMLDFGPGIFTGPGRWLEMGVRSNGFGEFTMLSPRQPFAPTPYAIMAYTASNLLGTLPAGQLSGTLNEAQLPANVPRLDRDATFLGALTLNSPSNRYTGTGSGLTGLDASQLSTGTLADARLSSNVALLDAHQTFSGSNRFSGVVQLTNTGNTLVGAFRGDGAGLSQVTVTAANVVGLLPSAQLTGPLPSSLLAGTYDNALTFSNPANNFAGSGAGLTKLNAANLSGTLPVGAVTNSSGSRVAYLSDSPVPQTTFESVVWPPNNANILFDWLAFPTFTYYGIIQSAYVPKTFTCTNVALFIGAVTNNTPAILRLFNVNAFPPGGFNLSSYTAVYTTNILVNVGASGQLQNFPVVAVLSSNTYVMASVICNAPKQIASSWYYNEANNTNGLRFPLWWADSTNSYGIYDGLNYHSAANGARLSGYQTGNGFGSATASLVAYNSSATGIAAPNVQTAIDSIYYPLNPAQTFLVVNGDSKTEDLFPVLTNGWFSLCNSTMIGVGGTSISFAVANWKTNAAKYYSNLTNGKNGVYIFWSGHNDFSSNPTSEIAILSNHISDVVSSNYLPVVITVQPRATLAQDTDAARLYVKAINNYIRLEPRIWRVVDAEAIMPNCYDPRYYSDTTHLNPVGNSIIANELVREITSGYKTVPPQSWVGIFGTNLVAAVPTTNGPPATLFKGDASGTLTVNGMVIATNGFASFSSGTGAIFLTSNWTNTTGRNVFAYVKAQAVALKNANATQLVNFGATWASVTGTIHMHPGWILTGTAIVGIYVAE